ncbi:hypothetical protein [Methylobacterium nodulans]|uniref:Uncharacterized protein n=1 Tax=Methylobacterium nodulans (strain LMG 21967 / CNCM I-2342 / ORS 2060) TaxID=460265 RepID=B8ITT1_METNO|nr:hypothetical protein [Methylobacterium nodulans]ACL58997.1 hypothetical protein Mnod_4118 [Methylobacterium nodulans ORS 2060]
MAEYWRDIATAPQDPTRRILVRGGRWERGNQEVIPQAFPSLVTWDGEWVVCDNLGPRSTIRDPVEWAPLPEDARHVG